MPRYATALALLLLPACAPSPAPPAAEPVAEPEPEPVRVSTPASLVSADPEAVGMDPALNARLDSLLAAALADSVASGAALAVGRHGRLVHLRGYGRLDWEAGSPEVDPDSTIYDLASLTKVVATTTAAMLLEQEGLLELDRPVRDYLPELSDSAKAGITVRMLLTHRGGLEAYAPLWREHRGRDAYLEQINQRPLRRPPGTATEYSDWDLILLQLILERLSGRPLDQLVRDRVFLPLGMRDTGFNPGPEVRERVAPTEIQEWRGGKVHGEVHDENAWAMGGVAGHAGLFSSARDLAVFAQMLLNGGEYGGVRLLEPQRVARWTAPQQAGSSRALGWDTPSGQSSAGRYASARAFGHTGFTGTSLWIDPERGLFIVLLTNRVNPTRDNPRIGPLRRAVADAVHRAVLDAPLIPWEARR